MARTVGLDNIRPIKRKHLTNLSEQGVDTFNKQKKKNYRKMLWKIYFVTNNV